MSQSLLNKHFVSRKNKKSELDTTSKKRPRYETVLEIPSPLKQIKRQQNYSRQELDIGDKQINTSKGIIIKPEAPMTQLSTKTTQLIANLRNRGQIGLQTSDNVMSQPSAKDRFSALLSERRELILPDSCKNLITLFKHLDATMNYSKQRQIVSSFSLISESVQLACKLRFDQEHLRQILGVSPWSYSLVWNKVPKRDDFELLLQFPDTENIKDGQISPIRIEQRLKQFQTDLVEYIRSLHNSFLLQSGIEIQFDPVEQKTWHSSFNIHEIQQLPMADLPQKPEQRTSVSEFIDQITEQTSSLLNVQATQQQKAQASSIRGVSDKVYQRIRAKVSAIKQIQDSQRDKASVIKDTRCQRMQLLTEYLHAHFINYSTPSHFINVLAKQFSKKYNFHFGDKVKFIEDLRELAVILPKWIEIKKVTQGEVVRMNRGISLTCLKESVLKYFN